jgi:hypothetical protein
MVLHPASSHLTQPTTITDRARASIRPLAAVFAVWMVLATGNPASAKDGGKPGHHCGCAERCKGAACCCPSDAPEPPSLARDETKAPAQPGPVVDSSPCVGSAPCGDPAAPEPTSPRPITRSAALMPASPVPVVTTSRLLVSSDDPRLPRLPASRLDDPPEGPTLA